MSFRSTVTGWLARAAMRFPRPAGWVFRAVEWVRRTWRDNAPGQRAWRGAALGLALATLFVVADAVLHRALLPYPTFDRLSNVLRAMRDAVLGGIGLVLLASIVARVPWRYRIALGACGGLLAASFPFSADAWVLTWGVVSFSALGAGVASISRDNVAEISALQRRVAVLGIVFGLASVGYLVYWQSNDGYDALEYRNAALEAVADGGVDFRLGLADPSAPGRYEVLALTYGSGNDIRRPEFGRDADLITPTVDGRPFLDEWTGRGGNERRDFWGFDRDELPLQARVWYPDAEGPFPLVLIVHGNHSMYEYSDPGYQYLGELLASRGMILASIDENFINGGIRQENDARGWLLLEHLKVWEAWNAGEAPGAANGVADASTGAAVDGGPNPFAGKVDMGRIGLIGHSRGGEAVAVAAAFNTLPYYPDDATVPFDYGFDIGAVIAIAPVMGQYQPGGRYTDLRDVNYFVIHGANDGDVSSFNGAGQYEHVSFSGDVYRFKSALYVMGANHGQFNSVWGSHDSGPPFGRSLSTRPLMPETDQRKIAEVYISAFLEAALRAEIDYLPLFADARAGGDWLPETAYLVEFDDALSLKVATFDEDVDVTTATIAGGHTRGEGLTVWREQRVTMKSRNKETAGVYIGWQVDQDALDDPDADAAATGAAAADAAATGAAAADAAATDAAAADAPASDEPGAPTPRYVIELPAGFRTDPAGVLFFSLADADERAALPDHLRDDDQQGESEQGEDPPDQGQESEEHTHEAGDNDDEENDDDDNDNGDGDEDVGDDEPREPIDFTVRVVDAAGATAELPLSRFAMVQPQLQVQLRKTLWDEPRTESEAVFQSFVFPLRWFADSNPALDVSAPARIELVFDRTGEGVVILDTAGFRVRQTAVDGPDGGF